MADYDGSIRIKAELDADPAKKEMSGLTGELEKSATSAGNIGSKVKAGLAIAGAAIGAATTAVGAFAKSAVEAGSSFDSSMSQVAATMGKTTNEIGDLRDFAMEMGANTAFSATQAADALNYMALAGYDSQQAMEALPNVLNLAAAGGMDLALASDMVTDAQSALGLTMDESAQLVDKMAMASSKSNTSVAQLGEAILTVGGTAKNLAGGTTELSTALGILADNGVKGAEGGTALRKIILSLSAPTDKAAKSMKELGVEVFDAEGNMRPLNETFADLDAALSTMTQGEQTQVLSEIFNKVDLKSVNALLANTGERFDELSGYIDNAAGAAEKMANTQLDNLAGDVTLFKSALEGAQIVLSDELTPDLREFTQFGTKAITTLSEAFKEGGLTGAMEALGTVLSDGLAMLIERLPDVIDAGMQLLGALGQGILDNLPLITDAAIEIVMMLANGIIEALPELADGAVQLVTELANGIGKALPGLIPKAVEAVLKFIEGLTNPESVQNLIGAAAQIVTGLITGISKAAPLLLEHAPTIIANIVTGLIGAVPQLIEAGVQLILGLGEGLLKGLATIPKFIKNVVDGIVNGFKSLFGIHSPSTVFAELGGFLIEGLKSGISDAWRVITEFFTQKPKEIAENLSKTWESIKATAGQKWEQISAGLGTAWETIKITAKDKFDQAKANIENAWDAVKRGAEEKWKVISGNLKTTWESVRDTAKDKFEEVRGRIGDAWENVKKDIPGKWSEIASSIEDKWSGIVSSAKEWGSDLCRSISDGISSGIKWVKDAAQNVADKISSFLHFSEPDVGPLSNFHTFMPDMLKLLAEGIRNNAHLAVAAANDLAGSISDALGSKEYSIGMPDLRHVPDISKFNIPALALGQVIPPKMMYEKVIDHQTVVAGGISSGEIGSILSVLSDIRAAVREGKVIAVDGDVFGRIVYDKYNHESGRVGRSMIEVKRQ